MLQPLSNNLSYPPEIKKHVCLNYLKHSVKVVIRLQRTANHYQYNIFVAYQHTGSGPTWKYRGLFQSMNVVAKEEGIKALW